MLKRLIASLLLIAPLSLTACARPEIAPDSSWVQPIYFEEETLQWLDSQPNWPPTLLGDLDKINRHNQKVETLYK